MQYQSSDRITLKFQANIDGVTIPENQRTPHPKVYEADFDRLRNSGKDLDNALVDLFRKKGLLDKNYGYSAFNPELLHRLVSTGQYRFDSDGAPAQEIFCCRIGPCPWGGTWIAQLDSDTSIYVHCDTNLGRSSSSTAIAVYDLTILTEEDDSSLPSAKEWQRKLQEYHKRVNDNFNFKPEALIGVLILKNYV